MCILTLILQDWLKTHSKVVLWCQAMKIMYPVLKMCIFFKIFFGKLLPTLTTCQRVFFHYNFEKVK